MSGGVPYLPHGALFSWVVSRFKAASLVAALNISRGSLYAQISTKAGDFGGQPVPIFGGGATGFQILQLYDAFERSSASRRRTSTTSSLRTASR
jgi:hypothetical protein